MAYSQYTLNPPHRCVSRLNGLPPISVIWRASLLHLSRILIIVKSGDKFELEHSASSAAEEREPDHITRRAMPTGYVWAL